jgi:nucleoside 2-deoxyribosyltransferase
MPHLIYPASTSAAARRIALANEGLIRSCDALIANLTPFRGVSMDSGTAFEVGFMRALGRPVLGYTNVSAGYLQRAKAWRATGNRMEFDCDAAGIDVEDFGLAENLMIEVAIIEGAGDIVRGNGDGAWRMADLTGFRRCLEQARILLLPAQPQR